MTDPDNIDAGGPNVPSAGGDVTADSTAAQADHSIAQAAARAGVTTADDGTSAPSSGDGISSMQSVRELLVFSGGRGKALSADLGRSGALGSTPDVFLTTRAIEN